MMISSHPLFYFMALFRALVKDKQENKHSENIPLHQDQTIPDICHNVELHSDVTLSVKLHTKCKITH